jgi:hypothetical protein
MKTGALSGTRFVFFEPGQHAEVETSDGIATDHRPLACFIQGRSQ